MSVRTAYCRRSAPTKPMPKRERYLWVCQNERAKDDPKGSCFHKRSKAVRDALKSGLVERKLHRRLRVMESSCLDLCWMGPAIAVMPDAVFYGRVRLEDVDEIIDALASGTIVQRLVVADDLFDDPAKAGKAEG